MGAVYEVLRTIEGSCEEPHGRDAPHAVTSPTSVSSRLFSSTPPSLSCAQVHSVGPTTTCARSTISVTLASRSPAINCAASVASYTAASPCRSREPSHQHPCVYTGLVRSECSGACRWSVPRAYIRHACVLWCPSRTVSGACDSSAACSLCGRGHCSGHAPACSTSAAQVRAAVRCRGGCSCGSVVWSLETWQGAASYSAVSVRSSRASCRRPPHPHCTKRYTHSTLTTTPGVARSCLPL